MLEAWDLACSVAVAINNVKPDSDRIQAAPTIAIWDDSCFTCRPDPLQLFVAPALVRRKILSVVICPYCSVFVF